MEPPALCVHLAPAPRLAAPTDSANEPSDRPMSREQVLEAMQQGRSLAGANTYTLNLDQVFV